MSGALWTMTLLVALGQPSQGCSTCGISGGGMPAVGGGVPMMAGGGMVSAGGSALSGLGGTTGDQLYPLDYWDNWMHGYWQEMPSYGGYHYFRPYNYKHVLSQSQVAGGWGMSPTMPISHDYFRRLQERQYYQPQYQPQYTPQPYPAHPYQPQPNAVPIYPAPSYPPQSYYPPASPAQISQLDAQGYYAELHRLRTQRDPSAAATYIPIYPTPAAVTAGYSGPGSAMPATHYAPSIPSSMEYAPAAGVGSPGAPQVAPSPYAPQYFNPSGGSLSPGHAQPSFRSTSAQGGPANPFEPAVYPTRGVDAAVYVLPAPPSRSEFLDEHRGGPALQGPQFPTMASPR